MSKYKIDTFKITARNGIKLKKNELILIHYQIFEMMIGESLHNYKIALPGI